MLLSHMDKDHPKNESRWSVYIHSGQKLTRVKKSNFSINSKESQNWVKKYICFHLHTDRGCQTDWGNGQWESKSQSFSFFFCLKRRMKTDSDRQTERNCQSKRQTKRVKSEWLREKENKILPTVNSDQSELRKRGGVEGKGVEGEKNPSSCLLSG